MKIFRTNEFDLIKISFILVRILATFIENVIKTMSIDKHISLSEERERASERVVFRVFVLKSNEKLILMKIDAFLSTHQRLMNISFAESRRKFSRFSRWTLCSNQFFMNSKENSRR